MKLKLPNGFVVLARITNNIVYYYTFDNYNTEPLWIESTKCGIGRRGRWPIRGFFDKLFSTES